MTTLALKRMIAEGRGAIGVPLYLAEGGDVNGADEGMPLLHCACEHQDLDAIRALVAVGADVNRRDECGQSPLHIAVDIDIDSVVQAGGMEMQFETTHLLLQLGADPGARDARGQTPRDWAAGYGASVAAEFDRRTNRST